MFNLYNRREFGASIWQLPDGRWAALANLVYGELTFATREEAVQYCIREGASYITDRS